MPFSTVTLDNHRFETLAFHAVGTSDNGHSGLLLRMYVVALARGALQSQFENVAFLVDGLPVLISLAGVERHWIVTQNAPCKRE